MADEQLRQRRMRIRHNLPPVPDAAEIAASNREPQWTYQYEADAYVEGYRDAARKLAASPSEECIHCQRSIERAESTYRCLNCDGTFHKLCLSLHFGGTNGRASTNEERVTHLEQQVEFWKFRAGVAASPSEEAPDLAEATALIRVFLANAVLPNGTCVICDGNTKVHSQSCPVDEAHAYLAALRTTKEGDP